MTHCDLKVTLHLTMYFMDLIYLWFRAHVGMTYGPRGWCTWLNAKRQEF
jgi:hypothetical protein